MKNKPILAIDTSCDDTSAAVVVGREVWSNVVASQVELHKKYGGVFPTVAKQAHKERIAPVVALAIERSGLAWSEIGMIAITQGPGLAPSLEIGIDYAKKMSLEHNLPLIPVNHIEGHVLSALALPKKKTSQVEALPQFPLLAVVVSGKHTDIVLIKNIGDYERVGWTIDDAAGEALDKFGRMVDLGYPAGPVVEELARAGNEKAFAFPLPMTASGNFNMSFSGLKTSARNKIEELSVGAPLDKQVVLDLCASFQYAVFHAITYKLNKFLQSYFIEHGEGSLFGVVLGGGVAANVKLRAMLRQTLRPYNLELATPYTKKLCSDNAAMIGLVASLRMEIGNVTFAENLESLGRLPNWRVGDSSANFVQK